MRLTSHPGQYTVLNSEDERVPRLAAVELEVQAELMDGMGLGPESVVVLHVGGAAGGRAAALGPLRGRLRTAVRAPHARSSSSRTTTAASGSATSSRCAGRIGRPVVWDALHHRCHDPDGIPDPKALRLALATWPDGVRPKIHFSTARTATERARGREVVLPQLRAHAELVDPIAFEALLEHTADGADVDVMLEAKAKDLAVLRLRNQLLARQVAVAHPARR